MLHLARKVIGAPVHATDGEIGTLEDFYFQDGPWAVRYLLVDTGGWLSGKRLLVPSLTVSGGWGKTGVHVSLGKDEALESPAFDRTAPLSRTDETMVLDYYGFPYYWVTGAHWGATGVPADPAVVPAPPRDAASSESDLEARDLRSVNRSSGYHLQATDREIGHVDDFLIRQETFRIPFLLVDTSNWIGGRSVIVSSEVLEHVDREHGRLHVDATSDAIERAPSLESVESAIDTLETGPPFTII